MEKTMCKRILQQRIALIITVIIVIVAVLPYTGNSVSAMNNKTTADIKAWLDYETGVFAPQQHGSGECVDFCNAYLNFRGTPSIFANATDWGCPQGWTEVNTQGNADNLQMGDLIVEHYSPYGHVAVYYGKENGYHYYVDQNSNYGTIKYPSKHIWWGPFSNPTNVYRLDNSTQFTYAVDNIVGGEESISLSGWVFDDVNISKSIQVHAYIDGGPGSGAAGYAIDANIPRNDVDAVHHCGAYHGFDYTISGISPGNHTVHLFANDQFNSTNEKIGEYTVSVSPLSSPVIAFDSLQSDSPGKITVNGWTYDPDDVTKSIDVHTYLFGQGEPIYLGSAKADVSRPDVDNAFHVGEFHGFSATYDVPVNGMLEIGVAAINIGAGSNGWADSHKNVFVGYDKTIPDGDYLIVNAGSIDKTSFYYLDIEGTAITADDGTNVSLCGPLTGEPPSCDVFSVRYNGGFYTIMQKDTQKALDVWLASPDAGADIRISQGHGGFNQQWAISLNGGNGYRIQSRLSGLSLDVYGGGCVSGTNVQQWNNHGGDSQSWLFIPYKPEQSIENGRYVLLSAMDETLELDAEGDTEDVAENTNVQIWKDTAPSQFNAFDFTKLNDGYYRILHASSGKSLDVLNGVSDYTSNVCLHTANDSIAQQWAVTQEGDYYVLRAKCSGYALDASSWGKENGTNVAQYPYNGNVIQKNQTWKIVPAEYSLQYDANGGSGAPASQTKYYKTDISLSNKMPSRGGYKFLGWSSNPTAIKAEYQPGDSFRNDKNTTLYAVWGKTNINPPEDPILKGDVNGDKVVDAKDLTTLAKHVAKIAMISDAGLLKAADVNGDGNVDAKDLTHLAKYVAKIIPAL